MNDHCIGIGRSGVTGRKKKTSEKNAIAKKSVTKCERALTRVPMRMVKSVAERQSTTTDGENERQRRWRCIHAASIETWELFTRRFSLFGFKRIERDDIDEEVEAEEKLSDIYSTLYYLVLTRYSDCRILSFLFALAQANIHTHVCNSKRQHEWMNIRH